MSIGRARRISPTLAVGLMAWAVACGSGGAIARQDATHSPSEATPAPEWMKNLVPDPGSPQAKAHAAAQRTRVQVEKDLRKVRAMYFRSTRNTETRQLGILEIRKHTDPAIFPLLLSLFEGEGTDVEDGVFDHLHDLKIDEADATLAWAAIYGKTPDYRARATKRLVDRTAELGEVSYRVKSAVALGLREQANGPLSAAANLAGVLGLYEAIPMLIQAQVSGGGNGGGGNTANGNGALAYILVGRQEAFVAQVTPVVGDSAVAFDPKLAVVTEGVILRVIDAVVITYHVDVHNALVALSTKGWGGQSTEQLGYDQRAWRTWFANEFEPYRRKVDEEAQAAARADTPPTPKP